VYPVSGLIHIQTEKGQHYKPHLPVVDPDQVEVAHCFVYCSGQPWDFRP